MEKNIPLLVSVTGWSGSGKTTFSEKLISELISRGLKVAAAKNAHQDIEVDKTGSDSHRYFKAGAEAVCLNSENSMTIFYKQRIEDGSELYILFPEADVIIAEGFISENSLRIEITGSLDDIEEMKNQSADADIIAYSSTQLARQLEAHYGHDCPFHLIHRDNIIAAADIISGLT